MSGGASASTLEGAERVVRILEGLGIETALIGAVALAVHGYVRATQDVDLATSVDLWKDLRRAGDELVRQGFTVELYEPDSEDPLGGVLNVRTPGADLIQVVNYFNPWRGVARVGQEAIETARPVADLALRVVDLPHLIALKLYAGGPKSSSDVLELLARHPDEDLGALGTLCTRLGLESEWAGVLKLKGT